MHADPTVAPERSISVQLAPSEHPPRIVLSADADWTAIREDAKVVLSAVAATWAGSEVLLDLGEREPDLFDLRRLVHLLKDDFEVNVIGLRCLDQALRRFAERELKVRIHLHAGSADLEALGHEEEEGAPEATAAVSAEPDEPLAADILEVEPPREPTDEAPADTEVEAVGITGAAVRIVQRTLRGGTVLRHSGDLVLYGDVNPGAEIIAGGSITILGTMMGMAQAGTRSGDRAWIMAHELRPTQLRIGPRITSPEPAVGGQRQRAPEIAYVQDGAIVIEPYRGRLPRNDNRRSDA